MRRAVFIGRSGLHPSRFSESKRGHALETHTRFYRRKELGGVHTLSQRFRAPPELASSSLDCVVKKSIVRDAFISTRARSIPLTYIRWIRSLAVEKRSRSWIQTTAVSLRAQMGRTARPSGRRTTQMARESPSPSLRPPLPCFRRSSRAPAICAHAQAVRTCISRGSCPSNVLVG